MSYFNINQWKLPSFTIDRKVMLLFGLVLLSLHLLLNLFPNLQFESKVFFLFGALTTAWGIPLPNEPKSRTLLLLLSGFVLQLLLTTFFPNQPLTAISYLLLFSITLRLFFIPRFPILLSNYTWVLPAGLAGISFLPLDRPSVRVFVSILLLVSLIRVDKLERTKRFFLLGLVVFVFFMVSVSLSSIIEGKLAKSSQFSIQISNFLEYATILLILSMLLFLLRIILTPLLSVIQKNFSVRFKLFLSLSFTSILPIFFFLGLLWILLVLLIGNLQGKRIESALMTKSVTIVERLNEFGLSATLSEIAKAGITQLKDVQQLPSVTFYRVRTVPPPKNSTEKKHYELIPLSKTGGFRFLVQKETLKFPIFGLYSEENRIYNFAFVKVNEHILGSRIIVNKRELDSLQNELQCKFSIYNLANVRKEDKNSLNIEVTKQDTSYTMRIIPAYQNLPSDSTKPIQPFLFFSGMSWISTSNLAPTQLKSFGSVVLFYSTTSQLSQLFVNETSPIGDEIWYLIGFFVILLLLFVLVAFNIGIQISKMIVYSMQRLLKGTLELRRGDLQHRIPIDSKDEFGEVSYSFNLMATDISRMLLDVREKERMEHDLEVAKVIQKNLLPAAPPELDGWQIAARNETAFQVGGDFYDFILLPNQRLVLTLGDVSGKGISAALLMSNVQAALRLLAYSTMTPEKVIQRLNHELVRTTAADIFVTLFYASIDLQTGEMIYVNAGHDNPILVRSNHQKEELSKGGTVVGAFSNMTYEFGTTTLQNGDFLFIFSDGLPEAMNEQNEPIGLPKITKFSEYLAKIDAIQGIDWLFDELNHHIGNSQPSDDRTVLLIKRLHHTGRRENEL